MVARTRQLLIEGARRRAFPAHQAEVAPRGAGLGLQGVATQAFWAAAGIEREGPAADLHSNRQILDGTEGALLLLDAELRVLYVNPPAMALLNVGDGLGLRHCRLVARHPDDDSELQAVLGREPRPATGEPEGFAVVRRQEGRPLFVKSDAFGSPSQGWPGTGSGMGGQDQGSRASAQA
jgi:PAS domain-containing protein